LTQIANNKQKQLPKKLALDSKVEGWAVCFCLSPLTEIGIVMDFINLKTSVYSIYLYSKILKDSWLISEYSEEVDY